MLGKLTAATFAACMACAGAQAASLDFVAEAAGNERGVADGTTITFGTLDVTFTSSHFAYFDDLSGVKPGGLGVCKVLTGSDQCDPSSDDNLSAGETVTLSFSETVDFNGLSFNDDLHNSLAGSLDTLLIGTNGGGLGATTFDAAANADFLGIDSITFGWGGASGGNYYISAATAVATTPAPPPIPVPASLPLLVGGLGLMGWMARRKKKAA